MAAKQTIGVGMLGYAFMGKAPSRAFHAQRMLAPPLLPNLVSISGRTADRVEEARALYGWAEAITDWREQVADDRVGLFDNGGPNDLHAEPTIAAVRNGKDVLCEKPLGRTADEAHGVWVEAARAGVVHMYDAALREAQAAKDAVRAYELVYAALGAEA